MSWRLVGITMCTWAGMLLQQLTAAGHPVYAFFSLFAFLLVGGFALDMEGKK
jgi:hypothetical protein